MNCFVDADHGDQGIGLTAWISSCELVPWWSAVCSRCVVFRSGIRDAVECPVASGSAGITYLEKSKSLGPYKVMSVQCRRAVRTLLFLLKSLCLCLFSFHHPPFLPTYTSAFLITRKVHVVGFRLGHILSFCDGKTDANCASKIEREIVPLVGKTRKDGLSPSAFGVNSVRSHLSQHGVRI